MKVTFYQKKVGARFLAFSLLLYIFFLSGCENFILGGNLRSELEKDIGVTYTFYEYPDDNANYVEKNYLFGKRVRERDFPTLEQDDYIMVGWEFYKNPETGSTIPPEYLQYDESHLTYRNVQEIYVYPEKIAFSAIWRPKCTVTFVLSATEQETVVVPQGERLEFPNFEYRRGSYRLMGWCYDPELQEPFRYDTPVMSDMTLYARWVEVYTVTYYMNDGSGNYSEQDCERNSQMTISDYMFGEREDYGFVGWSTSEEGGVSYYSGDRITVTSDMELFAVWSTDIVTISYTDTSGNFGTRYAKFGRGAHVTVGRVIDDENDWYRNLGEIWKIEGKDIAGYDTSATVGVNEVGDLQPTYDKWGAYGDGTEGRRSNYITVTGNLNFYVIWQDITYKVSFNYRNPNNPNSGYMPVNVSDESPYNTIIVGWNQRLTRPTAVPPVIPGWVFDDWYLAVWYSDTMMLSSSPFNFNVTFNDQTMDGRRYVQLMAKFVPSPSGAITGAISFDPASTAGSDISVSGPEVSDSYVSFTAPASFSTYEWKVNGTLQSLMTSHIAVFDTSSWSAGRHDIDLEVTDYSGNYYSWHGQIVKN